jgi:hypothetical protein
MDKVLAVLDRILGWAEKHLPGLIVSLGIGYKIGQLRKKRLVARLLETRRRLKEMENERDVKALNRNKSSADIVGDAIREGRDKRKR